MDPKITLLLLLADAVINIAAKTDYDSPEMKTLIDLRSKVRRDLVMESNRENTVTP